jgi:hypothetical protein
MNTLTKASLLLAALSIIPMKAFAFTLECRQIDGEVRGVKSVHFSNDEIIINKRLEMNLEKSQIKCGTFGRQVRYDGFSDGYQVILRSCSSTVALAGDLIDHANQTVSRIECD